MSLTGLFGDHPEVRILEFLAAHREFDYTISEISRNAGVSRPATYRAVERYLASGVLARTRRVGGSWFYRLVEEHDLVRPFLELDLVASEGPPRRRRLPAQGAERSAER